MQGESPEKHFRERAEGGAALASRCHNPLISLRKIMPRPWCPSEGLQASGRIAPGLPLTPEGNLI